MSYAPALTAWDSPDAARLADFEAPRPYAGSASVSVLIEVPAVRPTREARRPSASATARVRASGPLRRRRRLRREVRLAGLVLSAVAPLALAAIMLASPGPVVVESNISPAGIAAVRPPTVRLSIESPGVDAEPEAESPVVLPGYLLPDDGTGSEGAAHAGG
jgi:hypothetical protein